jgi:hypothetical protein
MIRRFIYYCLLPFTAYCCLLLMACVQKHAHVTAPSTAATQGSIDKAKTQIIGARASIKEAQRYNDISAEDARRIDAKADVLLHYLPK